MSARIKKAPMSPVEGFTFGLLLLSVTTCLIGHEWGDAADGAIMALFFFGWSSERRRADALQTHLDVVRRYQS